MPHKIQLSVALSLKNQDTTVGINNKMLKLTNETFDDNATVRVVTIVTLIYLPASFVSVSVIVTRLPLA